MLRLSSVLSLAPKRFARVLNANKRCLAVQTKEHEKTEKLEESAEKESPSFVMSSFRGMLQTNEVFPFPEPLTEDQLDTVKLLVDPIRRFYEEVNDPMVNDETASINEKTMAALWELGAFALQVPQEYGGLGLCNTQYTRCVEICGYYDLGVGITLGAHQSIGFKGILLYGTPEQKAKYLPKVSNGHLAAFCLTEPTVGSDASGIRTTAVKSTDGSHYVLNGSKIWISNGGTADIMTVFAKVKDSETGKEKHTAFIVERGFGGVTSGPPEKKMGIRCSNTAEIFFEDVKVPVENVLSEEGQGFKVAMNILNNGRFGMAAALSGTMRYCIKKAVEHATQRVQFGRTIDNYGAIQEKLARMAMLQYVTESLAYMISGNMDKGSSSYHLEAAISKCFASEAAWYVCDEAIQTLGGMGFMRAAGLERVLRDLRIFRIFEGANDVLKIFIALSGMQYASKPLKELQKALQNPAANLGLIIEEATKRASRAIGFRPQHLTPMVHPSLIESARLCEQLTEIFGSTVESSLTKYGKRIIDEQWLLLKIAYAAIDMYTMVTVLSRADMSVKKNLPSAQHEILMTNTWCKEAFNRASHHLNAIKSPQEAKIYSSLSQISKNVCNVGECVQINPLNF